MSGTGSLDLGEAFPSLPVRLVPGAPLGELTIDAGDGWEDVRAALGAPDLPASVTAVLAAARKTPVEYRLPLVVRADDLSPCLAELRSARSAGRDDDGAWLTLPGCTGVSQELGVLVLATSAQGERLRGRARPGLWGLPNGQRLRAGVLAPPGGLEKPYLVHDLDFGDVARPSPHVYQTYPINELPDTARLPRAPFAVLAHPVLRPMFGHRYVQASGMTLQGLSSPLRLPLAIAYDAGVPRHRVAVHETLLRALAIRNGEWCRLEPTDKRLDLRDRFGLLRDRQVVVRAVRQTGDIDVGYPVTRLTEELLDLLGLAPGDRVLVSGQLRPRPRAGLIPVRTVELRALPQRQAEPPPGIDLRSAVGIDTLPLATMDLLRRQELGVEHGQPVLMRPAFRSLAAAEFTAALNGLALAVAGSLVADEPFVALVAAVAFVGLLLVAFLRRFR